MDLESAGYQVAVAADLTGAVFVASGVGVLEVGETVGFDDVWTYGFLAAGR